MTTGVPQPVFSTRSFHQIVSPVVILNAATNDDRFALP